MGKRRLIIIAVTITVLLAGGYQLINILGRGRLVVKAGEGVTLSLWSLPSGESSKIGVGSADVRLRPGDYLLSAESSGAETIAAAKVEARKTSRVNINVRPLKKQVVLSHDIAKSIYADSGRLTFLNSTYRQIFRLDSGATKARTILPELYPIRSVNWFRDGSGLIDNGQAYFTVIDPAGGLRQLDLGVAPGSSNYAVNDSGGIAYLKGGSLLVRRTLVEPPASINLPAGNYRLSISDGGRFVLAISDLPGPDDPRARVKFDNFLIDLSRPKEVHKFISNASINEVAWAVPRGSFIYTSGNAVFSFNLKTGDNQQLIRLADSSVAFIRRQISQDSYIVEAGSSLWQFELADSHLYKLSGFEGSLAPNSVTYNEPLAAIFFSTDPSSDGRGGDIYRLSY